MPKNRLIVSYDIQDNKLRTKFSKFLQKQGVRIQYSVFEISHSDRKLRLICDQIEMQFKPKFTNADSVLLYKVDLKDTIAYGNASFLDDDLIIIG
ncbi:MAG: CRISPR-associated endonuclease Cas2 [Bacteroidales bacterium]